jgi:flagellar protein FliO/FliZ
VTAQQITTLHTMAPQADAPALQPVNFADTPFGQMLGKLKNKGGERDQ